MTQDDARSLVRDIVPRETFDRLGELVALVTAENARQNLIASSTVPVIWSRHILDSAQLVGLAGNQPGLWLDVGSGGGFPGLVVALMRAGPTLLVEPRSKRAAFLHDVAIRLGLAATVTVAASRVEAVTIDTPATIMSARAVAALPALFGMAVRHASTDTLWLLPKGRSAASEVAEARQEWQGDIRLVPSLSDSDSAIVVARGVRRKRG